MYFLKKSKGLEANHINFRKFNVNRYKDELMVKFTQIAPKMMKGVQKAKLDYKKQIETHTDENKKSSKEFWDEIIAKSKALGIDLIGFAPVDPNFIFNNDQTTSIKSLYDNGIVLGMEMDFESIETAPEPPAGLEALRVYGDLGIATNELADFIRSKGYGAIACHPLGGPILYPAMAVRANMGEIGRQGLLITKEFGPRQRLSMIATNASPLPETRPISYKTSEYCENCGKCIKECPMEAIFEEPIYNENGTITRIDSAKCFEYFYETNGCSICIKACPFHKIGYDKIFKEKME